MRTVPRSIMRIRSTELVILCCILAGCSGSRDDREAQQHRVDELEAQIEEMRTVHDREIDQLVASLSSRHEEETTELRRAMSSESKSLQRILQTLRMQLQEQSNESVAVDPTPERNEARPAGPGQPSMPRTPAITTFRPPLPSADQTLIVAYASPTPFPLLIERLKGENVVVGSHASSRLVKTEEEYRDKFGNIQKRVVREPVELENYEYQVSFAVSNLTEQAVSLDYRAGETWQTTSLDPSIEIELAVKSTLGSPLMVRVGNQTRHFSVPRK
jgi:hypothetical protein